MLAMAFRNVSYNTLTTRVPHSGERARFMSIQSAVQHGASASGAFLSSQLLSEKPGGAHAVIAKALSSRALSYAADRIAGYQLDPAGSLPHVSEDVEADTNETLSNDWKPRRWPVSRRKARRSPGTSGRNY